MPGRSRILACWLLLALLGGGVLSPTLHFLYMAGTMAAPHACDAADHAAAYPALPGFSSPNTAHPPCSYAALFATASAGTLAQPDGIPALTAAVQPALAAASAPSQPPLFTQPVRGPPVRA